MKVVPICELTEIGDLLAFAMSAYKNLKGNPRPFARTLQVSKQVPYLYGPLETPFTATVTVFIIIKAPMSDPQFDSVTILQRKRPYEFTEAPEVTLTWDNDTHLILYGDSPVAGGNGFLNPPGDRFVDIEIKVNDVENTTWLLPADVGDYDITVTLTDPEFSGELSWVIHVVPAPVIIHVSDLNKVYTSLPLTATLSTTPPGIELLSSYNGGAAPMNAGTYELYVWVNDPNYTGEPVTATFFIAKATPTLTWAPEVETIVYGTALGGEQLNAVVSIPTVPSIPGTYDYIPSTGTILNVNSGHLLYCSFTPTDVVNYNPVDGYSAVAVTPKTLYIYADNKTKTYGDPDPAFTYTVVGLVGSDTLSGALSRNAGEHAGVYSITIGTLSAGGNYSIQLVGGALTITAAFVIWDCPTYSTEPLTFKYWNGSSWEIGMKRKVNYENTMAVTWGWLDASDSSGHGPVETAAWLGISEAALNSWCWNGLITTYAKLHVIKVEKF